MAHLVVGALAVGAFLVTGMIMHGHQPPLAAMDWDDRLLFRSRHIYLLGAALVNVALGIRYALPRGVLRQAAAVAGSLLALASAIMLFFAFFAEAMAGRPPGHLSAFGLYALFGGVALHALGCLGRKAGLAPT